MPVPLVSLLCRAIVPSIFTSHGDRPPVRFDDAKINKKAESTKLSADFLVTTSQGVCPPVSYNYSVRNPTIEKKSAPPADD